MIPATNLLAFLVASFVIIIIPGPGVLFVIGRALSYGRRAALLSVLGHSLGVLVVLGLVAAGLGTIVAASAVALSIVKFTGALYLIYLGIRAFRDRRSLREAFEAEVEPVDNRRALRQAVLVGLTNPKSMIFFSAVLPQFVEPKAGAVPLQMLVLGVLFLAVALISDSVYALLAGSARNWFARSPKRLEAVGGAGGVMIIGLGASVAVSGSTN